MIIFCLEVDIKLLVVGKILLAFILLTHAFCSEDLIVRQTKNQLRDSTTFQSSFEIMASITPDTPAGVNVVRSSEGTVDSTTTFLDDTLGEISTPIKTIPLDSQIVSDIHVGGTEDIIRFLTRPTIIGHGQLGVSDTGIIASFDPFHEIAVDANKSGKLFGNYMVKADISLKLVVNAVRFQTGRYILGLVPGGGANMVPANYTDFYKMHTTNLQTITQLPHVEIDLGTQTHVELLIPFESMYPMFALPLTSSLFSLGKIFLIPYAALAAASGDTTCGYTLFGSFKNITLSGPTAQSSFGEQEMYGAGLGPVSTVARKIVKAATIIGEVPLLGQGAMTVGWIADIIGRAAQVFGWSKPIMLSAPMYMTPRMFPFAETSDQVSTARNLALVSTNRVISAPHVGASSVDEMSIDFIKQVFAYHSSANWSTSQAYGDKLFSIVVKPSTFITSVGVGYTIVPAAFPSLVCSWWRGSWRFRFKIVKNEFYSGRLLVSFNPTFVGTTEPASIADSQLNHRIVIDLRTTSDFEVCVPYINPRMYCLNSESIGMLTLWVLDPLVVPSSCPSSVTLLCEVAGGGDLEYAKPDVGLQVEPYVPYTTQSEFAVYPCHALGGMEKTEKFAVAASVSIGERLESLRQVAKLFTLKQFNSTLTFVAGNYVAFKPFALGRVTQLTSNAGLLQRSDMYGDWVDLISPMYVMTTGSHRVQFIDGLPSTDALIGVGIYSNSGAGTDVGTAAPGRGTWQQVRTIVSNQLEKIVDVNVPSYQKTIGRVTYNQFHNSNDTRNIGRDGVDTNVFVVTMNATDTVARPYSIARQAGDDWNCYGFVGTVPYVLLTQN
jgi:hypothetical protein